MDQHTFQRADRRLVPREPPHGEPPRDRLVPLILATYRVLPGLQLTLPEAAHLFVLRDRTCRVVLDDLVRLGHLRRGDGDTYAAA